MNILTNLHIVEPSEDNFKKIANDALKGLYDYFFINFMRPVSPEQLDQLAIEMVKANSAHKICRLSFSHLAYQAISHNFYTFPGGKENFKALYSGRENL